MKKQRFPPPVGAHTTPISRLSQNFMCRRARWGQPELKSAQQMSACSLDICELLHLGYSRSLIRRAWSNSKAHDPGYAIGLRVLALFPRQLRNRSGMTVRNRTATLWATLEQWHDVCQTE